MMLFLKLTSGFLPVCASSLLLKYLKALLEIWMYLLMKLAERPGLNFISSPSKMMSSVPALKRSSEMTEMLKLAEMLEEATDGYLGASIDGTSCTTNCPSLSFFLL